MAHALTAGIKANIPLNPPSKGDFGYSLSRWERDGVRAGMRKSPARVDTRPPAWRAWRLCVRLSGKRTRSREERKGSVRNRVIADPYSPVNAPAYDKFGGVHFADQIGTTRALMTEAGSLARAMDYDPYGSVLADSGGAVSSPYQFGGKIHQANISQSYFPYRFYSAAQARWTTRDPLGMIDGPNAFAYVGGDPVSRVDPLGLNILRDFAKWVRGPGKVCVDDNCKDSALGGWGHCRKKMTGLLTVTGQNFQALAPALTCPQEFLSNREGHRNQIDGEP